MSSFKLSSSGRVMSKVSELWAKLLAEEARTSKLQEQVRKQKAALKAGRKERQQLMDTCDQLIYANRRLQSDEKQASRRMRETLQDYRDVQKKAAAQTDLGRDPGGRIQTNDF